MFDFSLSEIAVVILAGVLLIGPKDLPVVIRTVAGWGRSLKKLAGEFKQIGEELLQQTELAETKKEIEQTAHYIIDDDGRRQRVYDITDMISPPPAPKEPDGKP